MSIYAGNNQSPFSGGGKSNQIVGRRSSMKRPRRAKRNRIATLSLSNRVSRSATTDTFRGNVRLNMGNSGTGLIRSANTQYLTHDGVGFGLASPTYDPFGTDAAGKANLYLICACGTDFDHSQAAFAGKKNLEIVFNIAGVDHIGVLDRDSLSTESRNYKINFFSLTSLVGTGKAISLRIDFTT